MIEHGPQVAKNFKVVVRVRPLSNEEVARGERQVCKVDSVSTVTCGDGHNDETPMSPGSLSNGRSTDLLRATRRTTPRTFTYDRVFGTSDSQELLYTTAVAPVVLSTVEGYNGSIIAYGQTGTGKVGHWSNYDMNRSRH